MGKRSRTALSILLFGYAFLYIPLILLVLYSFNESKYVTLWSGFSMKWYKAIFQNDQLLKAAFTSLKIGFCSATIATLLGTIAAFVLTRFKDFKGKGFLRLLTMAPMVFPEVILGIGFLLGFIAMGELIQFPQNRGILTVIIAHSTMGVAYVMTIVKVRLMDLDPSLIEAAMDLGARPLRIFFKITLPLIMPSLMMGWLLSFILSFDDLIISSFVSGAEITTLPMAIFSRVRFGLTPEVNVLGALIIVALLMLIAIGMLIKRNRRIHGLK